MPADQNLYRALEVSPRATPHEIHQAYELAKRTYGGESLATYSLFGPDERQAVLAKVEDAYRVLSDPQRRREYDLRLAAAAVPPPANQPVQGGHGASADVPEPKARETPPAIAIPDLVLGRDLRRIRDELGVTLQSIANQTRINITYLQYLEDDNHGKLPHPVYVRSYLVQYARVLRLDAELLVKNYLKGMTEPRAEE